ncbi:MAG: LysR family transcriptional regulator [Deltaproteobacteria bacterium]|nr:LysR family transcriptional regulator [Deltaproteobacteria bacterium]
MRHAPHPFSLRQLQYAVAVAETLSFRKAAASCAVSQPALSAQLAQLEAALGAVLFERGHGRVLLTAAGETLLPRARRLLVEADDLAEAARLLGEPLSGTLRLGVIPTVAPYLLPRVTPLVRRKLPKLMLAWSEEKTADLVVSLQAGNLDAAVVALEAEVGDVEHAVLARDPFVVAAPADHPLSKGRGPVHLSELRDEDVLLLDEGHCFRDQALAFCQRAHVHELEFRATSLATLAQMVAGGAGVTLLPELAAPTERRAANLTLRPLATSPARTLALIWRKGSPLAESLRKLAQLMKDAYPQSASR